MAPSDEQLKALAAQYIAWDTNAATRAAVQAMLDRGDMAALGKALGSRLEFGTAGLRGPMTAGYTAMNELVVLQTTQGLAAYLEQTFGAAAAHKAGVAIGWDHRAAAGGLCSQTFALIAAEVLLRRGFRVCLLPGLVHTPLVPYTVQQRKCAAGLMVTASHNPKEDDGYKVYWDNGAQIIPPHDAGIAQCIDANLKPWAQYDCCADAGGLIGRAYATSLCEDCTEVRGARCAARVPLPRHACLALPRTPVFTRAAAASSLARTHPLSRAHTLSLAHTPSLAPTHPLAPTHLLSHPHTLSRTHTPSLAPTHPLVPLP